MPPLTCNKAPMSHLLPEVLPFEGDREGEPYGHSQLIYSVGPFSFTAVPQRARLIQTAITNRYGPEVLHERKAYVESPRAIKPYFSHWTHQPLHAIGIAGSCETDWVDNGIPGYDHLTLRAMWGFNERGAFELDIDMPQHRMVPQGGYGGGNCGSASEFKREARWCHGLVDPEGFVAIMDAAADYFLEKATLPEPLAKEREKLLDFMRKHRLQSYALGGWPARP